MSYILVIGIDGKPQELPSRCIVAMRFIYAINTISRNGCPSKIIFNSDNNQETKNFCVWFTEQDFEGWIEINPDLEVIPHKNCINEISVLSEYLKYLREHTYA